MAVAYQKYETIQEGIEYNYLLPEHFAIAKANGIGYSTAYQRFYEHGWSIEKTITYVRKPLWNEWGERAKEKGVSYQMLRRRIKELGMTPEAAVELGRAKTGPKPKK